eukprot:TRINITY_DN11119_c0_g1_i1.p1 TRINITY_DN11119_c0_g1~~TRINITY_DN11119_c0_g1_i1.p1  ORF type:complete len:169 (-),score=33.16 TRINITY_DN11119_c0_g1_i1:130-588(-)
MKVLLLTIMMSFIINDPAPDPQDIHLHFHKGKDGYGETEVDPICVGLGAKNVRCLKRGDTNCFEVLPPDISTQQQCEDTCLAANADPGPGPQVTCVFFIWKSEQNHCKLLMANNREDPTKVCIRRKNFVYTAKCSEVNQPPVSAYDWIYCVE